MTNEDKRKHRINLVYQSILACDKKGVTADKKKLIAYFMVDYGLSRRKMLEYIKALVDSERVLEKEGELQVVKNGTKDKL